MNTLTKKWLEKESACSDGVAWFTSQKETNCKKVIAKLMAEDKFDWANWLIIQLFNRKQKIQYAVFAAEQVIEIYEKKYPEDKRPREAIEAAKKCIENNSKKNRDAADAAWSAAGSAAWSAAWSAADAAWSAARSAADAAKSAARSAAWSAASAADAAWSAAEKEMKTKIIMYGMSLLWS